MSAILLSRDLMTASKVQAAAARTGLSLRTVADGAALLADDTARLVLIDLSTSGLAVDELVAAARPRAGAAGYRLRTARSRGAAGRGRGGWLRPGARPRPVSRPLRRTVGPVRTREARYVSRDLASSIPVCRVVAWLAGNSYLHCNRARVGGVTETDCATAEGDVGVD